MIEINETTESDDSIIRRWEMAGLLDEVPDEEKADVAHLLHSALLFIIGSMTNQLIEDSVTEELCGMVVPTVRKIYDINNCVAINFGALQTMLEETLKNNTPTVSGYKKVKIFFSKISLFNSKYKVEEVDPIEITIEQVSEKYALKFCPHGKGMTDYCLPCNRVNNA